MSEAPQLTAAEAAFVLEEPLRSIKKALDDGPIKPARKGGTRVRALDQRDMLYLLAVRGLRSELTPKARAELYQALKQAKSDRPTLVSFGRFHVDLSDFVRELDRRLGRLGTLQAGIDFREDGEPTIKGTPIEVYRIAALLDGELSVEQVLEDFPGLSGDQVLVAKEYADTHPKFGRPFPPTTVKRALRAAGLDALDEVLGPPNRRRR